MDLATLMMGCVMCTVHVIEQITAKTRVNNPIIFWVGWYIELYWQSARSSFSNTYTKLHYWNCLWVWIISCWFRYLLITYLKIHIAILQYGEIYLSVFAKSVHVQLNCFVTEITLPVHSILQILLSMSWNMPQSYSPRFIVSKSFTSL